MQVENDKIKQKMKEVQASFETNQAILKEVRDNNFKLTQEVEGHAVIQHDLEDRITTLYKVIEDNNEKVLNYEKQVDLQSNSIRDLEANLERCSQEKDEAETKLNQVDKDRI